MRRVIFLTTVSLVVVLAALWVISTGSRTAGAETTPPPVSITVDESIGVSDGQDVLPPAVFAVDEGIGLADDLQVLPSPIITAEESIGVADEATIQIADSVAPATTATQNPIANANGWNSTNVELGLSASDNVGGSGVKEIHYSINGGAESITTTNPLSIALSTEGTTTITYFAKDNAGNIEATKSTSVKIDKTSPNLTFGTPSPASNAAGWNNSNVSIPFTTSDNLSGVAATNPTSPLILSTEGSAVNGNVVVTDTAGNSATFTSPTVKIDKTAPTINGSRTPAANTYGWNNTDVTVSFTASDGLSGVASASGPTTLSTEGASQSVTGTATDKAGNSASATVSGINIDKTAPTVSITGPATVMQGASASATVAASDSLSGLAIDPSGSQALDTSTTGTHTVTVTAKDKAGNSASATLTYTVWGINGPFAPLQKAGNGTGQFSAGSLIPVKFQITDGKNLITNATGTVTIGSAGAEFRWAPAKQQYVANVLTSATKGAFGVIANIDGVGNITLANVNLR